MGQERDSALEQIDDWVVEKALGDVEMESLFFGFCDRLAAAGVPVRRAHLAVTALHPQVEANTFRWWHSAPPESTSHRRTGQPNPEWESSPLHRLGTENLRELRFPLEDETGPWRDYALLAELRAAGFTEYAALLTPFGSPARALAQSDGMIVAWATDRPGGFNDEDMAALRRLQPRLAIAVKVIKRDQTALNVLSAYLGTDAGRRVLAGQIKRGDGENLHAVIWFSDLRDSTPLAERYPGRAFLDLLNAYFEVTAGAVLDHGGEVLRFIGDAVLAIFQASGPGGEARAARMALAAARDAEARLHRLNATRSDAGEEALDFGLALHLGEVLFGNIGVPERVEFTVVGPAANEVARLEGLTKSLGRRVIVSSALSRLLPLAWEPLGEAGLRGVTGGRRVYGLPPSDT